MGLTGAQGIKMLCVHLSLQDIIQKNIGNEQQASKPDVRALGGIRVRVMPCRGLFIVEAIREAFKKKKKV